MAINIGKNSDGDVTYANPPVNRVLFPNITEYATAEAIEAFVNAWLDDHPEVTTTVEDGSILPVKLDSSNSASDGYVLSYNVTAGKFEWYDVGGELDDINSDITELKQDYMKASNALAFGDTLDETVLFTSAEVSVGDTVYYHFIANDNYTGMISFYNSSDAIIYSLGKSSSSGATNDFKGSIAIPQTFAYAKVIAKRGTSSTDKINIIWLSTHPQNYELDNQVSDVMTFNANAGFIQNNIYVNTFGGYYSGRGVVAQRVEANKYKLSGSATNTVTLKLGEFTAVAGKQYKISVGNITTNAKIILRDSDNANIAVTRTHITISVSETDTISVYFYAQTNDAATCDLDVVVLDTSILSNKDLSDNTYSVAQNSKYYDHYTTIKGRLQEIESYDYAAFTGGCMWQGKETYVTRISFTHATPVDPSEWGKLIFHIIDRNGDITYKALEYNGFHGEPRDPSLNVTPDGRLLVSCFTTYYENEVEKHGSAIVELDSELEPISGLIDFVTDSVIFGNTVMDGEKYLYKCGYANGEVNIYKSTTPFLPTSDISDISFQKISELSSDATLTECTLSMCGTQLVCVVRAESHNPILYISDDYGETWTDETILVDTADTFVIHSPFLPAYSDGQKVIMFGSLVETVGRNPVACMLNYDTAKVEPYKKLYSGTTYSGYPAGIRLGYSTYGVMYYAHQGSSSALHYQRFDFLREFNIWT